MLAAIWAGVELGLTVVDAINTIQVLRDPHSSTKHRILAVGLFTAGVVGPGAGYATGARVLRGAARTADNAPGALRIIGASCGINSFSGETLVATPAGGQRIDSLQVGDKVLA